MICSKNRIVSIILSILAAAGMLFSVARPACVLAEESSYDATPLTNLIPGWPEMSPINEASGVVMDAGNGAILYSLNRDTVRYPASITKIMTALLAIENASPDAVVTMDETGLALVEAGSTNAGTVAGEEFTVEQCLYIMLLKSANDIATQLGKTVGGSVEAFADMMNARAAAIGCTSTHFVNPSGMPDSDHYTTAADMALIMRECLKNETFRKILGTRSYTVPPTNKTAQERVYDNHCSLIQPSSEYYYEPCIGGKTGFTQAAWRTLATAAEKDGRTLICVVMRGPDKTDYIDTRNLFEYGFQNFSRQELDGVEVSLPEGFDTSLLTEETEPLEDGGARITWKYKQMPVGSSVVSAENFAVRTGSSGAEPEPSPESTASAAAETPPESFGISLLPLVLMIVFAAAAVLFAVLLIGMRIRDRRARRRRRAGRRRRHN